jgi:hypothetical protein
MTSTLGSKGAIALALVALLSCSCDGIVNFLRDPAGDDQVFAGNLKAFVGKEVVV